MESNHWSTLLCHLFVLYGLCAADEGDGVKFPVKIDEITYGGENVVGVSYHATRSSQISILRNESENGWLDVWNSPIGLPDRELILTLKIVDMISLVSNALSILCFSTLDPHPLRVKMHFKSSDEVNKFRYYEIFLKSTPILSPDELGDGLCRGQSLNDYFEYKLKQVLYHDGSKVRRITKNSVILERIMIRNSEDKIVSQFHVRPASDTGLRFSRVIFTEEFFNVLPVRKDRIVLGISAAGRIAFHICLVFANEEDAGNFSASIVPYVRKDIKIQRLLAIGLFNL